MQENKNLVLAIVLCLIVLFGWNYLSEYMGWTPPRQEVSEKPAKPVSQQPAPESKVEETKIFTPAPGRNFTVKTPLYSTEIYTGGGILRSFILNKFKATIEPDSPPVNLVSEKAAAFAPLGLVINNKPSWHIGQWNAETEGEELNLDETGNGLLKLNGIVDGINLTRQLNFDGATYLIRENITLRNDSDHSRSVKVAFTQAMGAKGIATESRYDTMRVAWDKNGSLEDEADVSDLANGVQAEGQIYWAGPMTTYFIAASLPRQTAGATVKGLVENDIFRVALEQEELILQPGASQEISVSYWLGPKERTQMEAVSEQLGKCIDFGYFSFIGRFLIWCLELFYGWCHNWGMAIILLTLALRIIFYPLNNKSFKSMEAMRRLQPMMLQIREKYKGNREALNKEMMQLYKTYKVNPAGGCLPMLAQLPIFFGLYQALLSSIALRQASFITYLPGTHIIWLADLSLKDPLYITPILMGLVMFIQQRMTPAPGDPMQQKIMMFLPLIFTVLFISFPAGLVLYWLFNSILQLLQQWLFMRKYRKNDKKPEKSVS